MFSNSLDRKVLVVLSISVAVITAIIIYLTNQRLSRELSDEFAADSRETMSVIAAGIRQSMATGNSDLIQAQLLDIKNENNDLQLYICDTSLNVVFSSETGSLKKSLNTEFSNRDILDALRTGFMTSDMSDAIFEEQKDGKRYFMHSHLMPNSQECYRCHGSAAKVLGAIVLRKSEDRKYTAISELTKSNIVISILGVLSIIFLSHFLITRLISRPVRALAQEISDLPAKITDGRLIGSTDIARDDEIGELQRAFHNMAVELYEKNHSLHKANLDLANANKELEAFAYSVSHDLRAPLRNIDGFSKILLDSFADQLPEKARHYLGRVRNGTVRMSNLIDDILTFSRIGRADLSYRKVSAESIIRGVLENFTGDIEKRNISVVIRDLPDINCDVTLIQSLFLNIIGNAIKYSRNVENPEVVIGYDRAKHAIYVKDNGVGFEMQYHDKIFQIFQRLHLPEEYEGTGIGLAIVKRIAERHHGKVWAESEPGHGSTFYIDLPIF